ncbi:MAG: AAA family ATPase [Acidimicrobiales bacterium]
MTDEPNPSPARYGPATLRALATEVVGRWREAELVVAALMAGRHLLLEGPPGTGKSTLLRGVASTTHQGFEFVEGNAELTPARLVGHFDPAQVLETGYISDVWVDGPLARALREGALLYLEEINRIPEETLNLLVTVMSEGELTIPRLGRIDAHPNFRLVAAMNPFDAVGTARISGAIYDRVCRISMDYQSVEDEIEIATSQGPRSSPFADAPQYVAKVVELVRATRAHPEIRVGSSVRGAIDLLHVAVELAILRDQAASDLRVGLDAALTALSGRIRLHDSSSSSPEAIIEELWQRIMEAPADHRDGVPAPEPEGKAARRRAADPTTTTRS